MGFVHNVTKTFACVVPNPVGLSLYWMPGT